MTSNNYKQSSLPINYDKVYPSKHNCNFSYLLSIKHNIINNLLNDYLNIDIQDINKEEPSIFINNFGHKYLVLTTLERFQYILTYVKNNIYLFDTTFIAKHINIISFNNSIKIINALKMLKNDANLPLLELIDNIEEFIYDICIEDNYYINKFHYFINTYDYEEIEYYDNNQIFYIYRIL